MNPLNYTWANCHNITAELPLDQKTWLAMVDIMDRNGNHEFPNDFLPPAFCDPLNYVPPDRGEPLLIFELVTAGICGLVVLGRFLTRMFVAGRIGWDDWTIAMAVAIMWCAVGVTSYGILAGAIGRHIYDATSPEIVITLEAIFYHILLYSLNVFIVKLSLLFFYKRLFPQTWRRMQFCLSAAIVILFCYAVASCLASIFQCKPVHSFWVISLRYSGCPTLERSVIMYSGIRSVSVAFDIIVILLPMKFLWSLKLPLKQRLGLACVFGMGIIAIGAAFWRLVYQQTAWRSLDIGWNFPMIALAAQLEHFFAIVTASVPALTALFHNARDRKQKHLPPMSNIHNDPRYFTRDSLELTEATPNKFASDISQKSVHRPITPLDSPPRPGQLTVKSYTTEDFLTWAYDPERKNGDLGNGNYANAYGEYTMNQPKRDIFSRLYHGRNRKGGDAADASRVMGNGGVESIENLVHTPGGRPVVGNGMGHGATMEAMGMDNQIMMTYEVVVKVSAR